MKSFGNVIEPGSDEMKAGVFRLKGEWNNQYFKNQNPLVLELGCGKGEYSVGLASRYPGKNHIGIDIKGARIWRGAKTAHENNMPNVAFLRTRIEFINTFFSADEIDEIWITFPDPFPKPSQETRRMTSAGFLNSYRMILKDKGIIHLKTDNTQLFRYTAGLVRKNGLEIITETEDLYGEHKFDEILSIRTHYESIFLKEGIKIKYLSFRLEKEKQVI